MNMKKNANIVLCVVLGSAAALGIVVSASALSPKGLFMGNEKASSDMEAIRGTVLLRQYELGQDPDNYVKAGFIVENSSDQAVKNLEVRCEFYDSEDRYCDSELWVLHGKVPAGKQMLYRSLERKFISSRAANLRCDLVDLTAVKPAKKVHAHGADETHLPAGEHPREETGERGHGAKRPEVSHGEVKHTSLVRH